MPVTNFEHAKELITVGRAQLELVPPWNSLEIAKLCVDLATPIVVGSVGWWFSKIAKRLEQME